jgi:hypothetical protein
MSLFLLDLLLTGVKNTSVEPDKITTTGHFNRVEMTLWWRGCQCWRAMAVGTALALLICDKGV